MVVHFSLDSSVFLLLYVVMLLANDMETDEPMLKYKIILTIRKRKLNCVCQA